MNQSECSIPIRALKNGDHDFSFSVGRDTFAKIEGALIEDGDLTANVHLHKMDQMAQLDFAIEGTIKAQCDICLGIFDYPIEDCEGRISVKFGDHFEEISDELYEIDELEPDLDLGQWIYELVCVVLPIRFEHPEDEDGNSTCDPEMLEQLDRYLVDESEEIGKGHTNVANNDETDPRWEALRGLLDKN